MNPSSSLVALWVVTALLGAFHTLSPDHWVPLSVLSWQRGLTRKQIAFQSLQLVALHLALAGGLFVVLSPILSASSLGSATILRIGAALVAAVVVIRMRRLERMVEVFRGGFSGKGALWTTFSLLGPAESLVPLMIKAKADGVTVLGVAGLYGLLTYGTLTGLALLGHRYWSDPTRLARGVSLVLRPSFAFPLAAALGICLVTVLQFA